MKTHAPVALALLVSLALTLAGCGGDDAEPAAQTETGADAGADAPGQTAATTEPQRPEPTETLRAAGYDVAIWRGDETGQGRMEIRRGDELVMGVVGDTLRLGGPTGDPNRRTGLGEDITGEGVPNLVVEQWTGGTECCVDFLIYELREDGVEQLGRIQAHSGGRFVDYDDDGYPEVRARDRTFVEWNASFEDSPAPAIVLRWDGLWYTLAPELMTAEAPTDAQLAEWQRVILDDDRWDAAGTFEPPAQLWGVTLDLLYTGHPALAWGFINSAWHDDVDGREAFVRAFAEKLETSEYWPLIRREIAVQSPTWSPLGAPGS